MHVANRQNAGLKTGANPDEAILRGLRELPHPALRATLSHAREREHSFAPGGLGGRSSRVPSGWIQPRALVRPRTALLILLALRIFALDPTTASAHAAYDRSNPAANSIVPMAPARVEIWFTERLETSGTSAQLYNSSGQPVAGTASRLGDEPKQLILDLPGGLANGTYTVAWETLSADDGHPAQGYFAFTIGTEADVQQTVAPSVTTDSGAPQWMRTTSRWAALIGVAAATAIWPIWLFVFRPSFSPVWQAGPRLVDRTRRIAISALLLAFAGDLYALLVQAADLTTGTYLDRLQTVLTDTRYGRLWLLRIGLLLAYSVALLIAAWWWPQRRPGRTIVALLLALSLPLPISLNAHASAESTGRTVAIATNFVHLLAASVWIGGLFMLVGALVPSLRDLTARGRKVMLVRLLPRFSIIALTSWGVLIVTGLYQAWLEVGNLDGLLDTPYGRSLLIKLIILVPLLALAAFNLFVVTGRIRESPDSGSTVIWSKHLARAVSAEVVLVVILLLVVGRLTSLPPARGVLASRTSAIELSLQANDRTGTLTINPGAAGPNYYRLKLSGSAVPADSEALLRLNIPSQDIGEKEVKLTPVADGAFEGHGSELSIAGDWQITAIVRKVGEFQWQASTQTAIPAQAEPAPQPRPAWHFGTEGLLGLALIVAGVAGIVFALAAGRARLRLKISGIATCALIAGLLLLLQARTTTTTSATNG